MSNPSSDLIDLAREESAAYSPDEPRPLGGYIATMSAFAAVVSATATAAALTGRRAPEQITPWDVGLQAMATHKLARILAKDSVTSPLRAPFTRYRGPAGPAELHEDARYHGGLRHSLAELLTCPFCLGMWVSAGFSLSSLFAPRATRLAAASLAALAGSDFLQLAYARMEQAAE